MPKTLIYVLVALLASSVLLYGCSTQNATQTNETNAQPTPEVTYSVSMDVNPSISLTITNDLVKEVTTYNDDGESLLLDVNVIGLTSQQAMSMIIEKLVSQGYITENEDDSYLVITVLNETENEEEIAQQLEEYAKKALENYGGDCEIQSKQVTNEIAEQASSLGLSPGRYMLINYIAQQEGITIEEAIEKYGSMKINYLIQTFEGAEDILKENDPEIDEEDLQGLTQEQTTVLTESLKIFKTEVKQAEANYHIAFKTIKDTYMAKIKSLKKKYKNDASALEEQLNLLKTEMLAERSIALDTMNGTIDASKTTFINAITAVGISEEIIANYVNEVIKEVDTRYGLTALLSSFKTKNYGDEKNNDEDDNEDGESVENKYIEQNDEVSSNENQQEDKKNVEDQNKDNKENKNNKNDAGNKNNR